MGWSWTQEYRTTGGLPTWTLVKTPYGHGVLSCDGVSNSPSAGERALIAAAPNLDEALDAALALIRSAQDFLAKYIVPDSGISEHDCVNEMLGIFDGPEWRRVAEIANTAKALATAPAIARAEDSHV